MDRTYHAANHSRADNQHLPEAQPHAAPLYGAVERSAETTRIVTWRTLHDGVAPKTFTLAQPTIDGCKGQASVALRPRRSAALVHLRHHIGVARVVASPPTARMSSGLDLGG